MHITLITSSYYLQKGIKNLISESCIIDLHIISNKALSIKKHENNSQTENNKIIFHYETNLIDNEEALLNDLNIYLSKNPIHKILFICDKTSKICILHHLKKYKENISILDTKESIAIFKQDIINHLKNKKAVSTEYVDPMQHVNEQQSKIQSLNPTERLILALVLSWGASGVQISHKLKISPKKFSYHKCSALKKLGFKNIQEIFKCPFLLQQLR